MGSIAIAEVERFAILDVIYQGSMFVFSSIDMLDDMLE